MSLYDDAVVALIAEGAAGKDDVLYNIKPEEKLKATELVTGGSFDDASEWTVESGVSVTGGKAVFDGTSGNIDIYQDVSVLSGKTVKVSFTISDYVAGDLSGIFYNSSGAATDAASANGNFSFIKTIGAGHNDNVGVRGTNSFEGKVDNFSVKEVEQAPKDFTFTRGSNLTATRVAPSGYIEKGRENLVVHSNKLDEIDGTDIWYLDTGSNPSSTVTAGGITGYDGSTKTWEITKTTEFGRLVQDVSYDGVATISCYAKAGDTDWFRPIVVLTGGSNSRYCFFDLTGDGAVGAASTEVIDKKIEKIGTGGWFRCSFTVDESIIDVRLHPATGNSNLGTTGSVYVQNVQVEAGLVATDYIDSPGDTTGKAGILEDSPRFDYLDVTCPHLLMEPTRSNLVTYSEYAGGFTEVGTGTVTDNHSTSPEGLKNAFQLSESDTGFYRIEEDITVASENVGDHTLSVFIKKTTGSLSHYAGVQLDSARKYVIVDTTNGTANEHNGTDNDSFSVEDFSDDYWRVIITNDLASAADYRVGLWPAISSNGTSIVATATGANVFYGVQLEKGAYATSYIPNHGTSAGVTRNFDTTDAIDFSDYMDGKDITFFADLAKNPSLNRDSASTGIRFGRSNHNFGAFRIYRPNPNTSAKVYWADNDNDTIPTAHTISEAGRVKVIVRRVESTGEFTVFYAGAQKYQASNTDFDDFVNLQIRADGQPIFINSILVFDRALTDDECKSLTTV